jgi:hypothetical protein
MAKGDGIESKGHTKGKQYGIDGPKVGTQSGGKRKLGVSTDEQKAVGRGLARKNYQVGG